MLAGSRGRTASGPASTPHRTSPDRGAHPRRRRSVSPRRFASSWPAEDRDRPLMAEGRLAYHPTYFESDALAFLEFAERPSTSPSSRSAWAALRRDQRRPPLVSVITTIAKDHEKHLARRSGRSRSRKRASSSPDPGRLRRQGRGGAPEIGGSPRATGAPDESSERPGARDAAGRRGFRFVYMGSAAATRSLPPWRPSPGANAAVAIAATSSCRASGSLSTGPRSSKPSGRPAGRAVLKRSGAARSSSSTAPTTSKGRSSGRHIATSSAAGRPRFAAMQDKDLRAMTRSFSRSRRRSS